MTSHPHTVTQQDYPQEGSTSRTVKTMDNTTITQRIVDAADLILTTAATHTERTGSNTTAAFTFGEDRAAETYQLSRAELAHAARLATCAAFAMGAYTINAMANQTTRVTALRNAIPHITRDQPCPTRSAYSAVPRIPPRPTRPTHPKTSAALARHSARNVPAWKRFVAYLSRKPVGSMTK